MPLAYRQKENKAFLFAKRSFWLFLAKMVPTVTLLLITILYSRQLPLYDYGVFQSVWMLQNVGSVLIGFGLYSVLLAFGPISIWQLLKRKLKQIVPLYLVILFILLVLMQRAAHPLELPIQLLLFVWILLQTASFLLEAVLVRHNKETLLFTTNFTFSLFYFGWHYYLLQTDYQLQHLLQGIVTINAMRLFLYFLFCKTLYQNDVLKTLSLRQWWFIGFTDAIGILAKWMDKLLLVYFLTPAEFAIFFNGSIEIPLFGIGISVIGSLLLVEIAKDLSNREANLQLFRSTFLLLSAIVFPLFWFLLFARYEIFHVVFGNKYNSSIEIFLLCLLIIPVRITHYSAILQNYNKAKVILKGALLDIVIALAAMPLLYYTMGVKGVALAIVFSTYIQSYYYLYQSARVLHTRVVGLVPLKPLLLRFLFWAAAYALLFNSIRHWQDEKTLLFSFVFTAAAIASGLLLYFKNDSLLLQKLKRKFTHG